MTAEEMLETLDQMMETKVHDSLENGRMALLILYQWVVRRSATLKMYQEGSRSWCAVFLEIDHVLRTTPLGIFLQRFCRHSDPTIRGIAKHILVPHNPEFENDEEIDNMVVATISGEVVYPDLTAQIQKRTNRVREVRAGSLLWESLGLNTLCHKNSPPKNL